MKITPSIAIKDISPAVCRTLPSGHRSYVGRAQFIYELMDNGRKNDPEEICAFVKCRYPAHASPAHVRQIVAAYKARRKI